MADLKAEAVRRGLDSNLKKADLITLLQESSKKYALTDDNFSSAIYKVNRKNILFRNIQALTMLTSLKVDNSSRNLPCFPENYENSDTIRMLLAKTDITAIQK